MPKNYTLKAETGYLSSKLQGEQPEGNKEILPAGMLEIALLLLNLLKALKASNDFMIKIAFHINSQGHFEQTINVEILDQLIKANEDALAMITAKS